MLHRPTTKGGKIPGRAFIGLSPDEKHPSEFRPRRLPDEPMVTVWLVIGAA
jgi:hypothetical protein